MWDDLKIPFHETSRAKRYKDAKKNLEDEAITIDGNKEYGITDIISHSLGSAVSAQLNQEHGNIFRTRSYGAPHWSKQSTEDFGANLRIRGKDDIVSAFDNAPITVNKGSANPLFIHSFEGVADVKHKSGNEPLTKDYLEQMSRLN